MHVCEEGVHLGEVDPPLPVVVVLAKEGVEDPAQARLVLHGWREAPGQRSECARWHGGMHTSGVYV